MHMAEHSNTVNVIISEDGYNGVSIGSGMEIRPNFCIFCVHDENSQAVERFKSWGPSGPSHTRTHWDDLLKDDKALVECPAASSDEHIDATCDVNQISKEQLETHFKEKHGISIVDEKVWVENRKRRAAKKAAEAEAEEANENSGPANNVQKKQKTGRRSVLATPVVPSLNSEERRCCFFWPN